MCAEVIAIYGERGANRSFLKVYKCCYYSPTTACAAKQLLHYYSVLCNIRNFLTVVS